MSRPSPFDEYFVHQIPESVGQTPTNDPHWRESYFFDIHSPDGEGDAVFLTMARYPARQRFDSLQLGRIDGEQLMGYHDRPYDGNPHDTAMDSARIEIVRPWEEVRLWTSGDSQISVDLTFVARTQPYLLRRGTMRAGDEIVWDQSHILQSGTYHGTYSARGVTKEVDGWIGQRDHSWGIRDHARCPLWLWFQIQLDDGFLGVWHWELVDGSHVYTDGCWAGVDRSDPVPLVGFTHDVTWVGGDGSPADYGEHGESVTGLRGNAIFELENGRKIQVEAEGTFARPYEPFHRGGLNLMKVRTDDGRAGTAIYEVTGARHHRYFPETRVGLTLPS